MDSGKPPPPHHPAYFLIIILMCCTVDYCTYNVSKIGLNRLTELQAKALSSDASRPGILVNSVSTIILLSYVFCLYYG